MTQPQTRTDEELTRRGDKARQVLENEMYREAWASLVNDLMTTWEGTKPMSTEEREAIWHAIRAIKAHRQRLEGFMTTGRMAADRINQRKASSRGPGPTF